MVGLTKNFLFVILCGLLGGLPAVASADSFQPPDAILEIIKRSYSKFEIGNDSTCLRISSGGEFCAIAIDKTVEKNPDSRSIDMLLTFSKDKSKVNVYKIFDNFLDDDGGSSEISKVEFKIWEKLKSKGKVFSLAIGVSGGSRVYTYYATELTFFKLTDEQIFKISNAITMTRSNSESNGADKFSRHMEKRIIIIKEQKNDQFLLPKVSVCDDHDAILKKDRCDNKAPNWVNEGEIKFNDQSINFPNKTYFKE
jgi:hypothetical protein